ncbi:hypothetical protein Glove_180g89 [Diversispora epigaea]|uniref:Uncharacterized protein n=1 Tax=Diversispora epigaea TaxID=1348612 RepID=A0A397ISZ0_9GLOM|nr:hypothetical protein Glove_180g89 [Diversispora epigaea]
MVTGFRWFLGLLRSQRSIFSSLPSRKLCLIQSSQVTQRLKIYLYHYSSPSMLKKLYLNWPIQGRINELSEHLKYIIEFLGVVGRFLEAMIVSLVQLLLTIRKCIVTYTTKTDYVTSYKNANIIQYIAIISSRERNSTSMKSINVTSNASHQKIILK